MGQERHELLLRVCAASSGVEAALCPAGLGLGCPVLSCRSSRRGEQGQRCASQPAVHLPLLLPELPSTGESQIFRTGCLVESDSIFRECERENAENESRWESLQTPALPALYTLGLLRGRSWAALREIIMFGIISGSWLIPELDGKHVWKCLIILHNRNSGIAQFCFVPMRWSWGRIRSSWRLPCAGIQPLQVWLLMRA